MSENFDYELLRIKAMELALGYWQTRLIEGGSVRTPEEVRNTAAVFYGFLCNGEPV